MKISKLFIIPLLVLTISGCTLLPGNAGQATPTPAQNNYVEPSRPAGNAVSSFARGDFQLELFFENNKYLYYGTISLPTPCHTINVDSLIAESFPEQVTLNIKTSPGSNGACAEVITQKHFSGEIEVSRGASFTVRLDGQPVDKIS